MLEDIQAGIFHPAAPNDSEPDADESSLEHDTLTLLKTLGYPGNGLIFEFRIH
jgi:hypothetical protein